MELNGSNTFTKHLKGVAYFACCFPRREKSVECREQEVTITERWLDETLLMETLICCVAAEIEHEIDDFSSCEDGSAHFYTCLLYTSRCV